MNGNFEFDKGSYPYGMLLTNSGAKLAHIPTLEVKVDVTLPRNVAAKAALAVNVNYWEGVRGLPDDYDFIGAVRHAARECYDGKLIDGPVYQQIVNALDKLA